MTKKRPSVTLSRPLPSPSGDLEKLFTGTDDVEQSSGLQLHSLRLDAITPDPDQPRNTFNEESLQELADSIRQDGVIQPIEVTETRPNQYMIVHGERRWRAARLAGLSVIPAVVRRRNYDELTRFVRQLVENIQREDLNDVDRAYGMIRLRDLMQTELATQLAAGGGEGKPHSHSITWAKVSERLGFTRQRASQLIQLLDLPEEIKEAVRAGKISERDTRVLRGLRPSQQRALYRALEAGEIDGRDYRLVARYLKDNAPDLTVHEAIKVLQRPLPPLQSKTEPTLDSSLHPTTGPAAMGQMGTAADRGDEVSSAEQEETAVSTTTTPSGIQRLDWIRGHLARLPRHHLTPAARAEMLRLLHLIQQDITSLIHTLSPKS